MGRIKPVYYNDKQLEFLRSTKRIRYLQGGRGGGKSVAGGEGALKIMASMAGSRGVVYCKDITQAKTKEVLSLFDAWNWVGITKLGPENPMGSFCFGKPPKGFKVVQNYEQWGNVLSFPDGTTMEFVSERMTSNRGGSYDWGLVLEASLLNAHKLWKNLWAMVRGESGKYASPYYLSWVIMGNMPWIYPGSVLEHFETLAKDNDDIHIIYSNIYDNVAVYGKDYIEDLKAMTPDLEWRVEFMNERDVVGESSFYRYLDLRVHTYRMTSNRDPFYNPMAPLATCFDFNNTFNSCNVRQMEGLVISVQHEFFNHSNDDYKDLVPMVTDEYRYHINKTVLIGGDWDGWNRTDDNGQTYFDNLAAEFQLQGWTVEWLTSRSKRNPEHIFKHQKINAVLKEDRPDWPRVRINADRCPYTLISMKNARMGKDRKKDKSSESKLKGDARKLATDLSDVFDYSVWPVISHLDSNSNTIGIDVM